MKLIYPFQVVFLIFSLLGWGFFIVLVYLLVLVVVLFSFFGFFCYFHLFPTLHNFGFSPYFAIYVVAGMQLLDFAYIGRGEVRHTYSK